MKYLVIALIISTLLLSCEKDNNGADKKEFGKSEVEKIEIYLLKSSERIPGLCKVNPVTAVLADTPFTRDEEIRYYSRSASEFTFTKEASDRISRLPGRTDFAVTVNRKVIYYGVHMPLTMSSTCAQSITMHISNQVEGRVAIQLGYPGENASIEDLRGDSILIATLQRQGKLL